MKEKRLIRFRKDPRIIRLEIRDYIENVKEVSDEPATSTIKTEKEEA